MGAQLIVGLLEGIEDSLLEIEVRGRGPRGTGLQGLMQALVGPVSRGLPGVMRWWVIPNWSHQT